MYNVIQLSNIGGVIELGFCATQDVIESGVSMLVKCGIIIL